MRGEVIRDTVDHWLDQTKKVLESEENIIADRVESSSRRFMGCCFDLRSRYGLGKKAARNIGSIDGLIREGEFNSVSHSPPPPSTDALLRNENFVVSESARSSMELALDALRAGDVHIVGVHGMGGVGKTTLMKEVGKKAKEEELFVEVVMVTVSQNLNMKRIQTEIAEQLGLKLEEDGRSVRAARLSDRLKGDKKVLIILDDVWEMLELSEVGIPDGREHTVCRVVLTTRNKGICSAMGCREPVEIRVLSDEESWKLFEIMVGDAIDSLALRQVRCG